MNGRSSKAAGVTKSRLKRVKSDTNGRRQNARYGVDGLRTKKQDANGNSSREYGVGISTSASTPLTQNSTAPSISYISGPVILGAEIDGEFVYHLGDALSTVRDVVDDEGDVIRSFEFDEYGNMLNSSGSGTASPKTWIGGLSVNDDRADSGLWNMGHRNYDGVLGRFISRDPIGFSGSSLNLYAYPTNPVTFTDPLGLQGRRGLNTDDAGTFSDALGLLTRLAGGTGHTKYRNAAVSLSGLDKSGYVRINDPLVTDLGETRRGLQIGDHGINLKSSLFFNGSFQRLCEFPEQRFDRAVLAAGVLFHENWHWNNWSNYSSREPAAWQQELDFYRDLLLFEMKEGGCQSRLDTIWQIGSDRLAAGRQAGHVPTAPHFFDYRSQVLGL